MNRAVLQWCFILLATLLFAAPSSAQEMRRFKVHGGISYANISLAGLSDRQNVLGWSASATVAIHRNVGIAFDFAGQYDPDCADDDEDCLVDLLLSEVVQNYNSHQYMAGPEFMFPSGNWEPFVHALFGGVTTNAETIIIDTKQIFETSSTDFAMGFGGGVDWSIIPSIGLRVVQVDFIPVRDDDEWRQNIRIQGGFLFRF